MENAFSGHDKISDNNLLTMGLTSRYIDRESGVQFARFGFEITFKQLFVGR
jgi:LPS-assembly protein